MALCTGRHTLHSALRKILCGHKCKAALRVLLRYRTLGDEGELQRSDKLRQSPCEHSDGANNRRECRSFVESKEYRNSHLPRILNNHRCFFDPLDHPRIFFPLLKHNTNEGIWSCMYGKMANSRRN